MKKIILFAFVCMTIMPIVARAQSQCDTTYDYDPRFDTSIMYRGPDGLYHYKVDKVNLSEKEKRELEQRALIQVDMFNQNVKKLWERRLPVDDEYYRREKLKIDSATCELFIGNADYYCSDDSAEYYLTRDQKGYYYECNGRQNKEKRYISDVSQIYYRGGYPIIKVMETVKHRPVNIYISSIRNPKGKPQRITEYLRKARTNVTYEYVDFNGEGYTPTKNLQPVSGRPGVYQGTIEYYQEFRGVMGDGRIYSDRTYRTVTYEVRLIWSGSQHIWDIKLKDILATKTESLK